MKPLTNNRLHRYNKTVIKSTRFAAKAALFNTTPPPKEGKGPGLPVLFLFSRFFVKHPANASQFGERLFPGRRASALGHAVDFPDVLFPQHLEQADGPPAKAALLRQGGNLLLRELAAPAPGCSPACRWSGRSPPWPQCPLGLSPWRRPGRGCRRCGGKLGQSAGASPRRRTGPSCPTQRPARAPWATSNMPPSSCSQLVAGPVALGGRRSSSGRCAPGSWPTGFPPGPCSFPAPLRRWGAFSITVRINASAMPSVRANVSLGDKVPLHHVHHDVPPRRRPSGRRGRV